MKRKRRFETQSRRVVFHFCKLGESSVTLSMVCMCLSHAVCKPAGSPTVPLCLNKQGAIKRRNVPLAEGDSVVTVNDALVVQVDFFFPSFFAGKIRAGGGRKVLSLKGNRV